MKTTIRVALAIAFATIFTAPSSDASINPNPPNSTDVIAVTAPTIAQSLDARARATFRSFHGSYELSDGRVLSVYTNGATPMVAIGNEINIPLRPIGGTQFESVDGRFTVAFQAEGAAMRIVLASIPAKSTR
jgi:hypothetical protein